MLPIIGYGNYMLDIYHINRNYKGAQSGGTVFNVLANLSKKGFSCYAMGQMGTDNISKICLHQMESFNIDSSNLLFKDSVNLRRLHVDISDSLIGTANPKINFSKFCYHCGQQSWASYPVPTNIPSSCINLSKGFVIFDLLISKNKQIVARKSQENGFVTVADIGHIGPLTYYNKEDILEMFQNIDILQLNGKVATFLKTKWELKDFSSLCKLIQNKFTIITLAEDGAIFYSTKTTSGEIFFKHFKSASTSNIVDPSGAGDAFLSEIIDTYSNYYDYDILPLDFFEKAFQTGSFQAKNTIQKLGALGHLDNPFYTNHLSFGHENKCNSCSLII